MEEKTQPQNQERISNDIKAAMIAVAAFFDAISGGVNFIPFLGQILSVLVSIVAYCTLGFWLLKRGINFANPKIATAFFGSGLIKMIPILNVIPGLTGGIVRIVYVVQLEDKTGIKMPKKV